MKKHFYWIMGIILIACACSSAPQQETEGKVYQVDLQKKVNPFEEIFSKAEIIPLETVDNGLIVYCKKIYPVGKSLYIHDDWSQNLFAFSQAGKYEFQVGRKGQGPGEYLNLYDCIVDSASNEISVLESYGRVLQYDLTGKHKNTFELPARPNYYSIEALSHDCLVTWSALEASDNSVLVLNKENGETLNAYWKDDRMFNQQQMSPFYSYDGKTYFGVALRQQVYEVRKDTLALAYVWDFGKDNISEERLKFYLDIEHPSERNNKILNDMGTPLLPFTIEEQKQNHQYCYVSLRLEMGVRPDLTHVFYDKKKKKALVFDHLDGKECKMNQPLYFGEDYLLTDVLYDDREKFKSILPESEYQKLKSMLEDDNPCLLKLYFKKG